MMTIQIPDELARGLAGIAAAQRKTVEQLALDSLRLLFDEASSPEALLRSIRRLPHPSAAAVDDLEAAILSASANTSVGLAEANPLLRAHGEREITEPQRVRDLARRPRIPLKELLFSAGIESSHVDDDVLTGAEIEALLARRELIDRSSNCPHGRPTTLRLTLNDLEKQFKRTGF